MDLLGLLRTAESGPTSIASPFSDAEALAPAVAIAEALGLELSKLPLTRRQAIQVPPVARSRNLIVGAGAPLPLRALDATGPVDARRQPTFLYRTNGIENPYQRMVWTLDDLVFSGRSLWVCERGAKTSGSAFGPILDATRVPIARWRTVGEQVEVYVNDEIGWHAPESTELLLFDGPTNGLLVDARETLRAAQAIERAYVDRAQNPIPMTVIGHKSGATAQDALTEDEAKSVVKTWREARQSAGGAIGYINPSLEITTPGHDAEALLNSARNAVRIDVANHVGLPVALIDGGVSEESMTYRNAQGEVSRFYQDLKFWLDPIQHRLSMDDVVPRGQRVRFDLSEFDTPAPEPTGVPTED